MGDLMGGGEPPRSGDPRDRPAAGHPAGGIRPPPLEVELAWTGDLRFEAAGGGGRRGLVDGDSLAGLSPMETLLAALGSCAASDVVDILRKGRESFRSVVVRLSGERRAEIPRRFVRVRVEVRVAGAVERSRAERAVSLAFEKYCSVRATLDPELPMEIDLRLEP